MKQEQIREALTKGESGVVGGYSRRVYVEEICAYIKERLSGEAKENKVKRSIRSPAPSPQESIRSPAPPPQKKCLSSFENYTETSTFSRAAVLVVVPNVGLIQDIVKGLLLEEDEKSKWSKSERGAERARVGRANEYLMEGDEEDEFLLGLQYCGKFEEASSSESDVILATTKQLVEMGGDKVDSSAHFFKTEEELEGFERKAKIEAGVYSFLSGVDTAIFLDAHILEMQNHKNLEETLSIIREAQPHRGKRMDIRCLSSGEEKKTLIFLMDIPTPNVLSLLEKSRPFGCLFSFASFSRFFCYSNPDICQYTVYRNRNRDPILLAMHHIGVLSAKERSLLVIMKNFLDLSALKNALHSSSLLGPSGILFIDEHMSRNAIKEGIKVGKKTWVVTERFIFYRQRRLHQLLHPLEPTHIFSPYAIHPATLSLSTISRCSATIICNENEECRVSSIINRPFSVEKELKYMDYVVVPKESKIEQDRGR